MHGELVSSPVSGLSVVGDLGGFAIAVAGEVFL